VAGGSLQFVRLRSDLKILSKSLCPGCPRAFMAQIGPPNKSNSYHPEKVPRPKWHVQVPKWGVGCLQPVSSWMH
jgi:hypothetical protein